MEQVKARELLHSFGKFGIQLGLERIEKLLQELGRPQLNVRCVHVAGTNGKGSTSAFISAALQSAGLRTGLYTSPHLVDYPERFKIDGTEISWAVLGGILEEVKQVAERLTASGAESPTEFEVLTAAAYLWFAREKVEYAVIEVGLGGLLDSTNVIVPVVSVITNIGMDHMDRCGNTIEEIAAHKAGIIKPGVPVITGAQGAALEVIRQVAARNGSALLALGFDFVVDEIRAGGKGQSFTLRTAMNSPENYEIALFGRHQADNAALAVVACRQIMVGDRRLTPKTVEAGLAKTTWPGRFEVFGKIPPIVVDGAHNPDGAAVLRQTLDEVYGKQVVFLFGALADKDYDTVIKILFRAGDRAVVLRPDSDRAAEPENIARAIKQTGIDAETATEAQAALSRALELATPGGLVCVTGSLYMIGSVRELVRRL